MQICSDPLATIHSVRSDQQWCVTLPACYPTIFPYIPNNVECNAEDAPNANTFDGTGIIDSSLCANSQLIQRLRHKLDLYETSSNHVRRNQQYSADIVKPHISNENKQDILPAFKPRNPSFSQQILDRKNTNQRVLSTGSSNYSNLSDNSSQFSPTPSIQSLLKKSDAYSNEIDSKTATVRSSHSNDYNDRASPVMSIYVPSISRTPHLSKQQVVSNDQLRKSIHTLVVSTNDRHFSDDHMSTSSLSPSDNQQHLDSSLSSEHSTSTIQSPTSSISNSEKEELSTSSSSKEPRNHKIRKSNSWCKKLTKKIFNKHLYPTSFHYSSPDNISHMYANNRKRIDCLDRLHMKDAMAALEFDLTKEACQTLIKKKKAFQQNRLIRLLTASIQCCRSCRTQRRLATIIQRSIDIAIKNYR